MTDRRTADVIEMPQVNPHNATFSVTALYGANQHTIENVTDGTTLLDLTRQVKDLLNVPDGATMFVGGHQVGRDYALQPGDRVEYIKHAGEKA